MVERLDLTELFADYSPQGGEALDPAALLATWFFAYCEGISSTRRLEELCGRDTHYIYVCGDLHPDHTTLSRFRQRHAQRMPDYFVQMIRMAQQEGVSDFGHIAIDGTKMHAAASNRQSRDSDGLEKQLAKTREKIQEYLERSAALDELEEQEDEKAALPQVQRKIEKLRELEKTLMERQEQLEERKATLRSRDRAKHRINVVEPEARSMKFASGLTAPAYNAQVSVDTESQLIVGADLCDEPTDQGQFATQHQQVEANLGKDENRQYTADAGYNSLEQLEYVEGEKVDAVMPDPRAQDRSGEVSEAKEQQEKEQQETKAFTRRDFRYDAQADEYECPAGQRLTYRYTESKRGRRIRQYRASGCAGCPLRGRCIQGNRPDSVRGIGRDESEYLAELMARKASGEAGKARLKARACTVEPALGNIKSNLGFTRFRLRGQPKARAELLLMCIAHNLHKLRALMGGVCPPDCPSLSSLLAFFAFWARRTRQLVRPSPIRAMRRLCVGA
jgi:transposase